MFQTLRVSLLLLVGLTCINGYTNTTQEFNSAVSMEIELQPNQPQTVVNFLLWKLSGFCEMTSDTPATPISFKVLAYKGSLNGIEFSKGDFAEIMVERGDKFYLTAEAKAQVEITNRGSLPVKIKCTSGS